MNKWGELMKCEKCGYENSPFNIICEKCGSPLRIEDNIELKKNYNSKPRAIDIEAITPDHSEKIFDNTKQKVRYVVVFLLGSIFATVVLFIISLIQNSKANDIMTLYEDFMKSDGIGLLYIGEDDKVDTKVTEYAKNYDFEYLYVATNKVTTKKKNKIKNNLKLEKLDSTLVIIDNGEILDYMHKSNLENIEKFLEDNKIIPEYSNDTREYISKFEYAIKSIEPMILYVANNKNDSNELHNKLLEEFCDEYSINYTYVEGFYLTEEQKLKLLNKVNYSEIHDELLIIIDEGIVKEVTEFVPNEKKDYFEFISNYGIIDVSSAKNLSKINEKKLKEIITSKDKNIILFTADDCSYCEKTKPILGKIGITNNLEVYLYNINSDNQNSLTQLLSEFDYNEVISTPSVLITENSKIIDTVVGYSDKKIYEDKLKELGVIR